MSLLERFFRPRKRRLEQERDEALAALTYLLTIAEGNATDEVLNILWERMGDLRRKQHAVMNAAARFRALRTQLEQARERVKVLAREGCAFCASGSPFWSKNGPEVAELNRDGHWVGGRAVQCESYALWRLLAKELAP